MFSPAIVNKVNRDFYELSGWQELDVGSYPDKPTQHPETWGSQASFELGKELREWGEALWVDIPGIGAGYLSPIKTQLSPAQSNADLSPGKGVRAEMG